MDGREHAFFDAEGVVKHLCHRRKAVGRAARIRNHVVHVWLVDQIVDAEDERLILVLGRSRDDDLLHGATDMCLRSVRVREPTGRFDDDLDSEFSPGNFAWIALREHPDRIAVDDDRVFGELHTSLVLTVHGVVFEEVCEDLRRTEIVDGSDFEVVAVTLHDRLEGLSADAAESVDAHLRGHVVLPSFCVG